ncbi:hypothetical protein N7523_010213 [Penicillium sp. IBT 18751x]|nr:hypothetical protein N7523_010213 [Penicillium sp. IBT 18751x]
MDSDVVWGTSMNMNTDLLGIVCREDSASIAIALSRGTRELFQKLHDGDLQEPGSDLIQILSQGWYYLATSVQECMAAGVKVRKRIGKVAEKLHSLRNFQSLAAVVHGIQWSGFSVNKKYEFISDCGGDYELYLKWARTERSHAVMHFLFPFIKEAPKQKARAKAIQLKLQDNNLEQEDQWKFRKHLAELEEDDIARLVVLESQSYVVQDQYRWLSSFMSLMPTCIGY